MRVTVLTILIATLACPALADELQLSTPRPRLAQQGPMPAPAYAPAPPGAYAPAPPRPSNGVGMIVAGSILLGVGVVNLATAGICKTDAIRRDLQDPCLYASLGVGVAFSGAGIPLLVVGSSRRRVYKQWQQAHPMLSGLLEGVRISTRRDGAEVLLGARF